MGRGNLSFGVPSFSYALFSGTRDCRVGTKSVPSRNDRWGCVWPLRFVIARGLSCNPEAISLLGFPIHIGYGDCHVASLLAMADWGDRRGVLGTKDCRVRAKNALPRNDKGGRLLTGNCHCEALVGCVAISLFRLSKTSNSPRCKFFTMNVITEERPFITTS